MTSSHFTRHREALSGGKTIEAIASATLRAAQAAADEGIFVALCDETDVLACAKALDADTRDLPLKGLTFTVKDNVDVKGFASTSNCPGYGKIAAQNAPAVDEVEKAGAIFIGKTTMDQFATGLNGTRTPGPIPRNVFDSRFISGGSSSGSAVAVARGLCTFSLGSDTGGSGRVPAAANGIVGLKPTPGLVSGRGMVYCNRSFDVIPVFASHVADAYDVLAVIEGPDPLDPFAFHGQVDRAAVPSGATLAIPDALEFFGDPLAERAFGANVAVLQKAGFLIEEIDFSPFREAGRLVFESALVAERLVDYGDFIASEPERVMAPVRAAIETGNAYSARAAFEALYRLQELKLLTAHTLSNVAALAVPTVPRLFTIEEMLAEPMARNTIMGTYTYFANPLGLCAVALPGLRREDGLPSSVSVLAPGGGDHRVGQIATRFEETVTSAQAL
ncbi:MAG: amidase family protein [Pseudomonadota bacterium]